MSEKTLINGKLVEVGNCLKGVYLYEKLRTYNHRVWYAEEHIRHLGVASQALFRRRVTLTAEQLQRQVSELLRVGGYSREGVLLTLRLYEGENYQLLVDEVSLYTGYALRSLRPVAVVERLPYELLRWATSLREECVRWALQRASMRGAQAVLLSDGRGVVYRMDDAPLYAVAEDVLYTSPQQTELTRNLVKQAAEQEGLQLVEHPIEEQRLASFDELFGFDYRGVRTLSAVNGRHYIALKAERIANRLSTMRG